MAPEVRPRRPPGAVHRRSASLDGRSLPACHSCRQAYEPGAARRPATMRNLPAPQPATELSYEQYSGRACCYCGTPLMHGRVSPGTSRGSQGACVLDIEVYACPDCAHRSWQSDEN